MFLYTYYQKVGTASDSYRLDSFRWESGWVISPYDFNEFWAYLSNNRYVLDTDSSLPEYRGKTIRHTFAFLEDRQVFPEEIKKFVRQIEKRKPTQHGRDYGTSTISSDNWAQYELTPEDTKKITEMKKKYEDKNNEEKSESSEQSASSVVLKM